MEQKKLQELESELADVFRLPLDQTAADHISCDDVKERFRFPDKLRAAEAGSQSQQNSDRLRDIDERIVRLKEAFSDWYQSRSCGIDNDNDEDDDAPSMCSDCTLQALSLEEFSGQKLLEKDDEETAPAAVATPARIQRKIGKYCGVFGGGVIVGVVCMVLKLCYPDYLIPYDQEFLIPPT